MDIQFIEWGVSFHGRLHQSCLAPFSLIITSPPKAIPPGKKICAPVASWPNSTTIGSLDRQHPAAVPALDLEIQPGDPKKLGSH